MKKSLLIMREDLGCYFRDRPDLPDKASEDEPPRAEVSHSLEVEQTVFFGGNTVLSPLVGKKEN